jgi:hypothetical protein
LVEDLEFLKGKRTGRDTKQSWTRWTHFEIHTWILGTVAYILAF